ncbi:iron chelate uptake ABC transporter family permease subunit [Ureaplasma canigenitalium]|uniref:iron chelate uptake ABC transporter family permease subunit n=1 Tax=Ureaplasma canigenitalium TaxID=42092 RepID=UPI0004E1B027|nr:iron chelate uptake ABC transporter family permease subunit [Ureaplasma canigenitalium]
MVGNHKSFSEKKLTRKFIKVFLPLIFLIFLLFFISVYASSGFKNASWFQYKIIFQLLLSGFALGAASYLISRLTKNKLVDTSITGISNINLIVLLVIFLITDSVSLANHQNIIYALPLVFFVGSILVTGILQLTCHSFNRYYFKRLVIIGIVINLIAIIIAQALRIYVNKDNSLFLKTIILGSINAKEDYTFFVSLVLLLLALFILIIFQRKIFLLVSHEGIARQLGVNTKGITFLIFLIISLFTTSSYLLNGNVVFVGLVGSFGGFLVSRNYVIKGCFISGLISSVLMISSYDIFYLILDVDAANTIVLFPILSGTIFLGMVLLSKI